MFATFRKTVTGVASQIADMVDSSPNGSRNGASDVRFLPVSYNSQDSRASALQLILAVRPEWEDNVANVELVRCTDGITNTLLKAVNSKAGLTKEKVEEEAILLRAYGHGTDVIIDRQRETENHELLMKNGLAPELLARFENGMLYRYITGKVTSPKDLRQPSVYRAVARRLAQWHATVPCLPSASHSPNGHAKKASNGSANGHSAELNSINEVAPGKLAPNVWTVMQKWILALPTETETQRERQSLLQRELRTLVQDLSQRPGLGVNGLVFAHCDLLSGNIIVLPSREGSGSQVSVAFIDYEYATPSPAAFDLANHFAEWGGFDCDFNVLPTRTQREEFVREYVHAYFSLRSADEPVDEEVEVATLMKEVDLFRGLPGFYWGIWALIQAVISEIDFDYASYAETRLGEYWAWKGEADGSREASGGEQPLREKRWAQETD